MTKMQGITLSIQPKSLSFDDLRIMWVSKRSFTYLMPRYFQVQDPRRQASGAYYWENWVRRPLQDLSKL